MQGKLKRREILLKRILCICTVVYTATLLHAFYHNYTVKDMNALGMTFVAVLTPLVVPVAFKLLHFKPVYEVYIVSTIFMYFVSPIGSSYHWYSYSGFDKVLHSSSSRFIATLAVILYFYPEKTNEFPDKRDYHVLLVFINAVNITAGKIWEFYEYTMLIFFNNNCISHYSQDVHDAITDALCTTVARIPLTLLIVRYHKTGKGSFFTNVYKKFYERNIVGEQIGSDNTRSIEVYCITNVMTKNGNG